MKTIYLKKNMQCIKNFSFILLLLILSTGCNSNNDSSDAYGIFETDAVIVSSEVQGKVLQMFAERGKPTEAGSIAAVIDTTQFRLKLDQIEAQKKAVGAGKKSVEAQIAVFQEQKKNMLRNLKRLEALFADGAATQKQLDDLMAEINITDKQIANVQTQFIQINNEIEVLETQRIATFDQLQRCKVFSPVSGTVLETYIEKGELAIPGKAIYKIADLSELTLKVYVSGAQLPHLKIGQELMVLVDLSATENQSFSGIVTWISSQAEFTPKIIQTKEERVKLVYAVKVAVKNDGTLKIGMPGEIRM